MQKQHGRLPTDEEYCEALRYNGKKKFGPNSLALLRMGMEKIQVSQKILSDNKGYEEEHSQLVAKDYLEKVWNRLTDKQKRIVKSKHDLGHENLTFTELSTILGCSLQYVSILYYDALEKLK